MKSRPVYADGKVHICKEMCSSCIFRPGNLMKLPAGRVAEMIRACLENLDEAGNIPCHETIHGQAPQEAICRGFWDRYSDQLRILRLAKVMAVVEEV